MYNCPMVGLSDVFTVQCPYCGEVSELVIDLSIRSQTYIEDCQVCCRPMKLNVLVDDQGCATIDAQFEE